MRSGGDGCAVQCVCAGDVVVKCAGAGPRGSGRADAWDSSPVRGCARPIAKCESGNKTWQPDAHAAVASRINPAKVRFIEGCTDLCRTYQEQSAVSFRTPSK